MARVLVLCPLEIEARAARRAVGSRAEVRTTGPGERLLRATRDVGASGETPRLVILAGVCGGLVECAAAPRVSRVVDLAGASWDAPYIGPPDPADRAERKPVTVLGVHVSIEARQAKRALGRQSGAAIVDCESHLFAQACREHGLPWCIVRGVSDGPDVDLVPGADAWVNDAGETRTGAVLRDCVAKPWLIPKVAALGVRTRRALRAMSRRLVAVLDQLDEQARGADNQA